VLESVRKTGATGELLVDVAIISAVVIGVRLAWIAAAPLIARAVPAVRSADPGENWRERLVVGVIAVTLVGQGLTLAPLLRWLRVEREREWSPDEAIGRLEATQAALDRLDELEREERIGEERLRRMRELYRARFRRCMAVIGGDGEEARADSRAPIERYSELRRELIGVERDAILGLRNEGRLKPDVMREIQRDLDLEEAPLPA